MLRRVRQHPALAASFVALVTGVGMLQSCSGFGPSPKDEAGPSKQVLGGAETTTIVSGDDLSTTLLTLATTVPEGTPTVDGETVTTDEEAVTSTRVPMAKPLALLNRHDPLLPPNAHVNAEPTRGNTAIAPTTTLRPAAQRPVVTGPTTVVLADEDSNRPSSSRPSVPSVSVGAPSTTIVSPTSNPSSVPDSGPTVQPPAPSRTPEPPSPTPGPGPSPTPNPDPSLTPTPNPPSGSTTPSPSPAPGTDPNTSGTPTTTSVTEGTPTTTTTTSTPTTITPPTTTRVPVPNPDKSGIGSSDRGGFTSSG